MHICCWDNQQQGCSRHILHILRSLKHLCLLHMLPHDILDRFRSEAVHPHIAGWIGDRVTSWVDHLAEVCGQDDAHVHLLNVLRGDAGPVQCACA